MQNVESWIIPRGGKVEDILLFEGDVVTVPENFF